jgi:hypothetical protein
MNALDLHFLYRVAATLKISRSELLRRTVFSMRAEWIRAGLYTAPHDLRVVPLFVDRMAALNRGGRHPHKVQDPSAVLRSSVVLLVAPKPQQT